MRCVPPQSRHCPPWWPGSHVPTHSTSRDRWYGPGRLQRRTPVSTSFRTFGAAERKQRCHSRMRNDAHVVEFRTHVDSIIRPAKNVGGTITGRYSHLRDCRCIVTLIFSTSYSGTSLWIARGRHPPSDSSALGDYIDRPCIRKVLGPSHRTQLHARDGFLQGQL
jgi:hypothetical protein